MKYNLPSTMKWPASRCLIDIPLMNAITTNSIERHSQNGIEMQMGMLFFTSFATGNVTHHKIAHILCMQVKKSK